VLRTFLVVPGRFFERSWVRRMGAWADNLPRRVAADGAGDNPVTAYPAVDESRDRLSEAPPKRTVAATPCLHLISQVGSRRESPAPTAGKREDTMTPLQEQAIDAWAQKNNISANQQCPACGGTAWRWADVVTASFPAQPGLLQTTGPGAARLLRRRCNQCGYCQFFDATKVGV
jgi:hypothetical protein